MLVRIPRGRGRGHRNPRHFQNADETWMEQFVGIMMKKKEIDITLFTIHGNDPTSGWS